KTEWIWLEGKTREARRFCGSPPEGQMDPPGKDSRARTKAQSIASAMTGGGVSRIVYIEAGYEQHCLGTPNSGRPYARRAHASRSCPRSGMSPSVGSILGEQGQQPADQCRLYARQHRTGA